MIAILVIAAVVAAGAIIVSGGGHTVDGFGRDMQNTGSKVERSNDR